MSETPTSARYLSVDFYRGLTIAFMIIVNTAAPGTWDLIYKPLSHATWHGCTPTDMVFPSFMFIIGVSMWFSFAKYDRKWSAEVGWKILRRTILIFCVGLIVNKFPYLWRDFGDWRIMGVMQRLGLCYGIVAVIALNVNRRVLMGLSVVLLLGYWALLYWLAAPGMMDPYSLQGNAVLRLDLWLFGERHLYHGEGIAFDPEGVLSTLPAVVTVILGWLSGQLMTSYSKQKDVLVRDLLFYGLICGFVGLTWDLFFPINKKLWTSSYVLYAGGVSMVLLAASIWVIDIRKWRNGTGFFLAFGSNPLFAYVLSELLIITLYTITWQQNLVQTNVAEWVYTTVFRPFDGGVPGPFSSFLFALCYMLLCWLVCRWLYVRRIFIKI